MNFSFLGSVWTFLIISLIFYQKLFVLLLGLFFLSIFVILLRLIYDKKRVKPPKNMLLEYSLKYIRFDMLRTVLKELNNRSFVSMHVARLSLLFFVLGSVNSLLYIGFILSFIVGYIRINNKYHDFIDVILGFIFGVYFGYVGLFIIGLVI